ncbi:MAG: radical SAM family heme chaperone HemW [Thermodesulfovibrionales bacterium]
MPVSYLYIHIPFCLRKCLYCDFLSIPFDQSVEEKYIDTLIKEIELKRHNLGRLKTIYIGGGTPTVLSINGLYRLCQKLKDIPWSEDIEITIEANPGTIDSQKIRTLKEFGVNRFSLGIQSFIDRELELLGRIHNSCEGIRAIKLIKDESVKNLSIDLIYGIPGQSITDWQYNLSRAIEYSPEHISTYELTPEKETPLYDLITEGRFKKPDEDRIIDMYYHTIERLNGAGYIHYEISNFAKDGFQCRHNLNYWDRGEYIGVGAGAHSFEDEIRRVNLRDVRRYIDTVKKGLSPYEEETVISKTEALKEYLFLGLRKREGIDAGAIKERFKIDIITASSDLISNGLLEVKGDSLRLTSRGITLSNLIIVRLFETLGL